MTERPAERADPLELVGQTLAERLRVTEYLGPRAGGLAYDARDLALDRGVGLLCVCVPEGANPSGQAAFFDRFAEVLLALRGAPAHPGRIAVLAGGAARERGFAFLVLEGVSGLTLPEWLERRRATGPFGALDVLQLLQPLAEVLAESHAAGIVHGRLEPSCVLVHETERGPLPYLLGHGIAAALAAASPSAAYAPSYGSPEHVEGRAIGVYTDVHGFGRILVEAMLGRPLLAPDAPRGELERALTSGGSLLPADLVLPASVASLCERALALEPGERFADGGALFAALRQILPPQAAPPAALEPPKRHASLALLIVAGIFTVLSTLAPFFYWAFVGYRAAKPPPPVPAPTPPAAPPSVTVELYGAVSLSSPEPVLFVKLPSGEGRWHWRVERAGSQVTKLELLGPSGRVRRWVEARRGPGVTEWRAQGGGSALERVYRWRGDRLVTTTGAGMPGVDGCAERRVVLDTQRRAVEHHCLDSEGTPYPDPRGCELRKNRYDADGTLSARACFAADGTPRADWLGVHEVRVSYDAAGLVEREDHYDVRGVSAVDRHGCSAVRSERAADGSLTRLACEGGPVDRLRSLEERARPAEVFAWDAEGCLAGRSWVDAVGGPVARLGFATLRYGRTAQCEIRLEESMDRLGAPTRRGDRAPQRSTTWDDKLGRALEERCSSGGKATSCSLGGAAVVLRFTYDDSGRLVSTRGFSEEGQPVPIGPVIPHELVFSFDEAGRRVAVSFADATRAPTQLAGGATAIAFGYDRGGSLASLTATLANGEPVAAAVCLDGVCWPRGAANVELDREHDQNVFSDARGRVLTRRDCSLEECPLGNRSGAVALSERER